MPKQRDELLPDFLGEALDELASLFSGNILDKPKQQTKESDIEVLDDADSGPESVRVRAGSAAQRRVRRDNGNTEKEQQTITFRHIFQPSNGRASSGKTGKPGGRSEPATGSEEEEKEETDE